MWNEYAREKLDELERERLKVTAARPHTGYAAPASPGDRRLLRPVARAAGSRVRRLGEALEVWASAPKPHAG